MLKIDSKKSITRTVAIVKLFSFKQNDDDSDDVDENGDELHYSCENSFK